MTLAASIDSNQGTKSMPRLIATAMAVGGVALVIASLVIMNIPHYSNSFPILLIGGGVLLWMGIHKYRATM